jgi:hypothetical protein
MKRRSSSVIGVPLTTAMAGDVGLDVLRDVVGVDFALFEVVRGLAGASFVSARNSTARPKQRAVAVRRRASISGDSAEEPGSAE